MKTLQEIFSFALINNLHPGTDSDYDAWTGCKGTLYLAEGGEDNYCVMFDVCEDHIAVEVYQGFMSDGPITQLHLASTDLPML